MKLAGAYWRGDHQQRDAAADVRHGLGQREGSRSLPHSASRKPRSGITGRWAANSISSTCRKRAREWCSGTPRASRCGARSRTMSRRRLDTAEYIEVRTPQVLDRKFWEQSGHWEKYRDNMFVAETAEDEVLSLKPMNCPGHVQIFKQGQKPIATCPCAWPSSALVTATSLRARCMA